MWIVFIPGRLWVDGWYLVVVGMTDIIRTLGLQENPDFYIYCLTSYNVPELVKGKVNINPYNLRKAVMEAPVIRSKYEIQND